MSLDVEIHRDDEDHWRWSVYDHGHRVAVSARGYPNLEKARDQVAVLFPGARVNVTNGTEGGPP